MGSNMTIAELHKEIIEELTAAFPPEEARALSYALLQHFGHLSRTQLHAFPETIFPEATLPLVREAVQRLLHNEPLQYVTGETLFCGFPIAVNSQVLIPRPETEELVAWAVQELKVMDHPQVVDLCTGSGCIAIALKKLLPAAGIHACDISAGALEVAKSNAANNHVAIRFFEQDIINDSSFTGKVDAVISNPPYIRQSEKILMHDNVLSHEPHLALFVDDSDPLVFYRAIAQFATLHLNNHGLVFVEINEAFGEASKALFTNAGFSTVELRKDLNGKDRMLVATRQSV